MNLKPINPRLLRTDKVRQRRIGENRAGVNSSASRKFSASNRPTPPVMMRSATGGAILGNRKTFRSTRRYIDIPLNAPGAEIRLPALPRIRIGWRYLSFLLFSIFALILYLLWNSTYFRIDQAKVSGLTNLTSTDVNKTVDLIGKSVFLLDEKKLEREIMAGLPELSQVKVEIALPDVVQIAVVERIPAVILQRSGMVQFVDEDGMSFPVGNDSMLSSDYPVVYMDEQSSQSTSTINETLLADTTGQSIAENQLKDTAVVQPEITNVINKETVAAVILMDKQAPDGAEFHYDNEQGLWWRDRRGWDVIFGSAVELEKKLVVYKAILEFLKAQDQKPAIINVEFAHAPYYKLEQ